jgi:hypothetical protein
MNILSLLTTLSIFTLVLAHQSIHAAELRIQSPALFDEGTQVKKRLSECVSIETVIPDSVLKILTKKIADAKISTTAHDMTKSKKRTMIITILDVIAVGGGGWSGPKTITVQADIYQNGEIVKTTVKARSGKGGFFGAVKGTCAIVQNVAEVVGSDIARWYLQIASKLPEQKSQND